MNLKRLVICDRDKDYCTALAEYIRRSDCGYEVITYTEPSVFCRDCAGREISVLLIQENFLAITKQILSETFPEAGRQFVLTENREAVREGCSIYKYRSADSVVSILGEDIKAAHRIVNDMEKYPLMRLIGVYSPLNHNLKTTFALTLGQVLAEENSVLYINMEGYNGLTDILDIGNELTFSDLIYDYSLNPGDISGIISKYTVRSNELNILIPARSPFELQETETAIWLSLLSELAQEGRYSAIILDISDAVHGTLDLLNVCTEIYMPVRKDSVSMYKLKDFEYILSKYPGAEGIRSKSKKLNFPYFEDMDGNMRNLKNSRLSGYIRQEILQGTDHYQTRISDRKAGHVHDRCCG